MPAVYPLPARWGRNYGFFPASATLPSAPCPGVVSLEMFGAVGDNVTNDRPALVAALATGQSICLGAKTYYVPGGGVISSPHQSIFGWGAASELRSDTNGPILSVRADLGATNTTLGDFTLRGSGAGASQVGVQNGVLGVPSSGDGRAVLVNLSGFSLGKGLAEIAEQNTTASGTHEGTRIHNPHCENSGSYALDVQARAEYVTVDAPRLWNCSKALYIGSGNFSGAGPGSITDCGFGVELGPSANDAHGVIGLWTINHCAHAVYAHGITLGFDFVGCHFFFGDFILGDAGGSGCVGVTFKDCTFGSNPDFYFQGSTGTKFLGNTWQGAAPALHFNFGFPSTEFFDAENLNLAGDVPAFLRAVATPTPFRSFGASSPVLTDTDRVFGASVTSAAGARTITLPAAAANPGRIIATTDTAGTLGTTVITATPGDTIDGGASVNLGIGAGRTHGQFQSDGVSDWVRIA